MRVVAQDGFATPTHEGAMLYRVFQNSLNTYNTYWVFDDTCNRLEAHDVDTDELCWSRDYSVEQLELEYSELAQ